MPMTVHAALQWMHKGNPQMSAQPTEAALLTPEQTARILNVSPRTLSRMVATGEFPQPYRHSKKLVRYRRADVNSFIENIHNK
jgi:excisionase family DNA binding protein